MVSNTAVVAGSISVNRTAHTLSSTSLPRRITRVASAQTYYTIALLVDRDRTTDAYRAYAYFRWLDDTLDEGLSDRAYRTAFVARQQALVERMLRGEVPHSLTPEEHMLLDLIRSEPDPDSGLHTYIRSMMAVMAFDADRRGRLISQQELDTYTQNLAVAVTEALHYYIGHDKFAPRGDARYLAVTAAHVTHMLRDTHDDIIAGYYNVPREYLEAHGINAWDVETDAYREWVWDRVQMARDYFDAGKAHLARTECGRCRLAGYAYMARFEGVLEAIEREGYRLRPDYPERKQLSAVLRMAWFAIHQTLVGSSVRVAMPHQSWA